MALVKKGSLLCLYIAIKLEFSLFLTFMAFHDCIRTLCKILYFLTKMSGGMSSTTNYSKLNFDFPYVKSLSLHRDTFICVFNAMTIVKMLPFTEIYCTGMCV